MSTAQDQRRCAGIKEIIVDFIDRWKWWLAKATAFYLFWCAVVLLKEKNTLFLFLAPFVGPAFIGYDLQRQVVKIHSLLPIPRRTLAMAYWIQAVVVPTVLIFSVIVISLIVIGAFKPSAFEEVASVPHTVLLSFALSGTLYLALTLFAIRPQPGFWNNLLLVMTWGTLGLAVIFLSIMLVSGKRMYQWATMGSVERVLLIGCVALSFLAWIASPRLMKYGVTYRPGTSRARERMSGRSIAFPGRSGGLLEPWFRALGVSIFCVLFATLAFLATSTLLYGYDIGSAIRRLLANLGPSTIVIVTILTALTISIGIRFLWSLRLLRSLPVSSRRLTFFLVSHVLVACLGGFIALFFYLSVAGGWQALTWFTEFLILVLGLLLSLLPLFVRFGPKIAIAAIALLAPIVSGSAFLLMVLTSGGTASVVWLWTLPLAVVFGMAGVYLTHRVIKRNSQAYRPTNFIGPGGMGR